MAKPKDKRFQASPLMFSWPRRFDNCGDMATSAGCKEDHRDPTVPPTPHKWEGLQVRGEAADCLGLPRACLR